MLPTPTSAKRQVCQIDVKGINTCHYMVLGTCAASIGYHRAYLKDLCRSTQYVHAHCSHHSSAQGELLILLWRTSIQQQQAFYVAGPALRPETDSFLTCLHLLPRVPHFFSEGERDPSLFCSISGIFSAEINEQRRLQNSQFLQMLTYWTAYLLNCLLTGAFRSFADIFIYVTNNKFLYINSHNYIY